MEESKYVCYRSTHGQLGILGKTGTYDVSVSCLKETPDLYKLFMQIDLDKTFRKIELPIVVDRLDAMINTLQTLREMLDSPSSVG